MEYTVDRLGKMAGISTRTLRYYDEIELLKPLRINSSGYRIYGQDEVDLLQQILFYRELGMKLSEIKKNLNNPDFDSTEALNNHLSALIEKQKHLNVLIANVKKTISAMKGENTMSDKEKFEGFKQKLIYDNESLYGAEIRDKYGDITVDNSNKKIKGMSKEQYEKAEKLRLKYESVLKSAFLAGEPESETAQKTCELHKQWLCCFYDKYNKEYHRELAQMYVDDPRFKEYYDKIAVGCAEFLRNAILIYCE